MQSVVKIPFVFQDGKTHTISLIDPSSSITQTNVNTFGNYAITNNLLSYGGYEATSLGSAYIYNTNEIPLT